MGGKISVARKRAYAAERQAAVIASCYQGFLSLVGDLHVFRATLQGERVQILGFTVHHATIRMWLREGWIRVRVRSSPDDPRNLWTLYEMCDE